MKLKEETRVVLNTLNYQQVQAMEDLKNALVLSWSRVSLKKDTEFDTLWALAGQEQKHVGLVEFLKIINDPHK